MKKPKRRQDMERRGNYTTIDPETEIISPYLTQALSNVKYYSNNVGLIPEPDVEMERTWNQENTL